MWGSDSFAGPALCGFPGERSSSSVIWEGRRTALRPSSFLPCSKICRDRFHGVGCARNTLVQTAQGAYGSPTTGAPRRAANECASRLEGAAGSPRAKREGRPEGSPDLPPSSHGRWRVEGRRRPAARKHQETRGSPWWTESGYRRGRRPKQETNNPANGSQGCRMVGCLCLKEVSGPGRAQHRAPKRAPPTTQAGPWRPKHHGHPRTLNVPPRIDESAVPRWNRWKPERLG